MDFQQSQPSRTMKALVAFSLLHVSSGFSVAPSSRRGTSIPFRIAPSAPHHHSSSSLSKIRRLHSGLHALVADEKEELHKRKEDDGNSNDWIETSSGGFLPNFLGVPNSSRVPMNDPRILSTSNNDKKNNVRWLSVSSSSSTDTQTQPLITEVKSLQDYKAVVADERDAVVVVRFYASWCRACRAVAAPYRQLASKYRGQKVKFVEVPLTPENAVLHQGLGVPSLPYGHIYHPEAGLVEERSLNKKRFGDFVQILQTYVDGECPIEWETSDAEGGSA